MHLSLAINQIHVHVWPQKRNDKWAQLSDYSQSTRYPTYKSCNTVTVYTAMASGRELSTSYESDLSISYKRWSNLIGKNLQPIQLHCVGTKFSLFQFRSFILSSECLFSLINGDDMFNTYTMASNSPESVFVFSKIYLYVFVALFIYVVLSVFISLIEDTYRTLHVS